MTLDTLIKGTLKDYRKNFKAIFWLLFCFYLIPSLLLTVLQFLMDVESFGLGEGEVSTKFIVYFIIFLISLMGMFFVYLYGVGALTAVSIKNKKFSFKNAKNAIKGNYWRYIGFFFVSWLFIIGLFILLIIPGIIFVFYWVLAPFVFFAEKKGIIDSLKGSFRLVRGRWWKTFGYGLFVFAVVTGIGAIFGGIVSILSVELPLTISDFVLNSFISLIDLVPTFVTLPFGVLFYKNLYLEYRRRT